jgi:putative PIN family toxin of toxin-antitoxin system
MLPLRLVLDTNIVVSAALKPKGLQHTTFLLAIRKPCRLYVSAEIVEEYAEVLARPELRIARGTRLHFLQLIKNHAYTVTASHELEICGDSDDNIFLESAEAARADYLITGNLKHFPVFWRSTKAITAREFVGLAAPHLLQGRRM